MAFPLRPLRFPPIFALFAVPMFAQGRDAEPAPPSARPNAASVYRLAADELRTLLASQDAPEIPYEQEPFDAAAWAMPLARAGHAIDLFAQAAQMPDCTFGPGDNPVETEFDAQRLELHRLMMLTIARGRTQLATAPGTAVDAACAVLRYARHIWPHPSMSSTIFSLLAEQQAARLLRDAIQPLANAHDAPRLARCRDELARHLRERPSRATLADKERDVALAVLDWSMRSEVLLDSARNDETRTFISTHRDLVRKRFTEITTEMVAPLRESGPLDIPAIQKHQRELVAKALAATKQPEAAAIADLPETARIDLEAQLFASLLTPNVARLAENALQTTKLLDEASASLAATKQPH